MKKEVPIWEKTCLSIEEVAALVNIGENKLYELTNDENCPFVLWVGKRRLIKRKVFEEYIAKIYSL